MVLGYNGSTYDFGAVKCEIDIQWKLCFEF